MDISYWEEDGSIVWPHGSPSRLLQVQVLKPLTDRFNLDFDRDRARDLDRALTRDLVSASDLALTNAGDLAFAFAPSSSPAPAPAPAPTQFTLLEPSASISISISISFSSCNGQRACFLPMKAFLLIKEHTTESSIYVSKLSDRGNMSNRVTDRRQLLI